MKGGKSTLANTRNEVGVCSASSLRTEGLVMSSRLTLTSSRTRPSHTHFAAAKGIVEMALNIHRLQKG
jgi:hypothetical protein